MLCWKRDIALLFLQSFVPHLLFTREGYALASDAESLIYLLSFVSGCAIPEFDSM